MISYEAAQERLGEDAPLSVNGLKGPPDRRDISKRWLAGTILTGVTSCALIGFAFTAAFQNGHAIALPIEFVGDTDPEVNLARASNDVSKQSRIFNTFQFDIKTDRRRMVVPTMIQQGDASRVRSLPFMHVKMPVDVSYTVDEKYPAFDPFGIFAEDGAPISVNTGLIYGASTESELALRTRDFPSDAELNDATLELTDIEVEQIVREQSSHISDGEVELSSIHYVNANRFGTDLSDLTLAAALGVKITPENISVASTNDKNKSQSVAELIIEVPEETSILTAFAESNIAGPSAENMAEAMKTLLNSDQLKEGQRIRLAVHKGNDETDVMRATLYNGNRHLLTVALDDRQQYVPANEPEQIDFLTNTDDDDKPARRNDGKTPNISVYDAIYRASLAYDMNASMARRIVRMLASDIDLRTAISAGDHLEVLFNDPDENNKATDTSAVLYVSAKFGSLERAFYRFESPDGTVDFYNEEGRSARQFLLRNPVPTGKFRSGFGMRRHPILRYSKMHWGVDWSAPRGTPIIAPGNGVITKAGWASGYGKQTVIRHPNGYETSYSHQSRFAKGIQEGARVRQGQVIGYIGTTGLSTGPHLHYEMKVNGNRVDPQRVRLPTGKALEGDELIAFERERDRINILLERDNAPVLASLAPS